MRSLSWHDHALEDSRWNLPFPMGYSRKFYSYLADQVNLFGEKACAIVLAIILSLEV